MVWPNPILTHRALSSNQNCKMGLGRLWREIKICILNSRLTAPVGKATGEQAGIAHRKLRFSWEQLEVQCWVVGSKGGLGNYLQNSSTGSGHSHGRTLSLGHRSSHTAGSQGHREPSLNHVCLSRIFWGRWEMEVGTRGPASKVNIPFKKHLGAHSGTRIRCTASASVIKHRKVMGAT